VEVTRTGALVLRHQRRHSRTDQRSDHHGDDQQDGGQPARAVRATPARRPRSPASAAAPPAGTAAAASRHQRAGAGRRARRSDPRRARRLRPGRIGPVTAPTSSPSYSASTTRPLQAPPVDALLLVSFGGPEGPDDVLPFMQNVTRGPRHPGGPAGGGQPATTSTCSAASARSTPRPARSRLRSRPELAAHGPDLPVYWGNRNWHPFLADAVRAMRDDGAGTRWPSSPAPSRRTAAAGSTARTGGGPGRRSARARR
jgi:hypothetical protein